MSNDFLKENIKKKPLNKSKIIRRTIITIVSAIVFGIVASLTILVLEPFLRKAITKTSPTETTEDPAVFKNAEDEMSPEEMLADYMAQEAALKDQLNSEVDIPAVSFETGDFPLSAEQVEQILSQVSLDRASYRQLTSAMTAYYRELSKHVVTITSSTSSVNWLDSINNNEKSVSGLIVGNNQTDLLILADVSNINVEGNIQVSFYGGYSLEGTFYGVDKDTNFAIIGVHISGLPAGADVDEMTATLGNSVSTYVGMPVIAVGSPMGVSGSMGYGILNMPKTVIPHVDWSSNILYTDIAGANNSSGILFNFYGQVIGIITNKDVLNNGTTLVHAYGISELKKRIERISNNEAIRYLGITATDVTAEVIAEQGMSPGAYILATEMDSPAMRVGIQVGDVISSIDGVSITSVADYVTALNSKDIDQEIELKVMRKTGDVYTEISFSLVVMER